MPDKYPTAVRRLRSRRPPARLAQSDAGQSKQRRGKKGKGGRKKRKKRTIDVSLNRASIARVFSSLSENL